MNTSPDNDDFKSEVEKYIGESGSYPERGRDQLSELMADLEDTYPDDKALQLLSWRAWTANAPRSGSAVTSSGLLEAERARVERWALYLQGKSDPAGEGVRRLWYGLDACFNPNTEELEEWFFGFEAQMLEELTGKYGRAPEGEPPAIFN